MKAIIYLSLIIVLVGCDTDSNDNDDNSSITDSASYIVEFTSTWSATTHPDEFPTSPHFSGLIGSVHSSDVTFWETEATASTGVKLVAERGATSTFSEEVNLTIISGSALSTITGGGITLSPGTVSTTFSVTREYPLVTLLSMLAPSPDWFVGVNGLSMLEEDEFLTGKTVTLYCYDAGTDSGTSYESPDQPTTPQEQIYKIGGSPFLYEGAVVPVGTFKFYRIEK
jgi:hypothetical protein